MTTDELILTGLAMTASAVRTIVINLVVPVVALGITLATLHREQTLPALPPARSQVVPTSSLVGLGAPTVALATLPVRELRLMARAAGHKALTRSGRRAQLLEVLA